MIFVQDCPTNGLIQVFCLSPSIKSQTLNELTNRIAGRGRRSRTLLDRDYIERAERCWSGLCRYHSAESSDAPRANMVEFRTNCNKYIVRKSNKLQIYIFNVY